MVYRKLTPEERQEDPAERLRRQKRESMQRAYAKDPDKYRQRSRDYKKEDDAYREHVNRKRREWSWENPELQILTNARSRAKRKGLTFDLTRDDILIPEFCPLLGIEIKKGKGKIKPSSPTLDRIDNSKGYIKGNVAVISNKANRHKGDLTISELEKMLAYAKGELL